MSWFGFGGGSSEPDKSSTSTSAYGDPGFNGSGGFADSGNYAQPSAITSGGGGGGDGSFQEQAMALGQQQMLQQLMFKLTERGFEQCVQKPSSSLSC